ncbi:MAG: hypothetical protein WBG92_14685, partial [Thiohalocapsa sp.]
MHCDEFRRRLMIDPLDPDPCFRDHAGDCPDCASAARHALEFEARLRGALADAAGAGQQPRTDRRARLLLLLVPLLAALGWWWAGPGASFDARVDLTEIAVEHVRNELW